MLMLFVLRYNVMKECPRARTCTIILRGGAEQFIAETERSLHDAIMIVRRAIKNDAVVAGTSLRLDLTIEIVNGLLREKCTNSCVVISSFASKKQGLTVSISARAICLIV